MRVLSLLVLVSVFSLSINSEARKRKSLAAQAFEKIDESLVQAPKPNEVCFSPGGHCDIKLVKFIESANKSLDIAIFDINLDQLVHSILVKAKTIKVRMVVDGRQAKGDHSLVSTLQKGGVDVRFGKQKSLMHNKFTIVDGKIIETGSFNYTYNATKNNNENQIYLDSPAIVSTYVSRFDTIWSQAY